MVPASLLSALCYASAGLLFGGLTWRIVRWVRTPVPLKIPLTPAPTTPAEVPVRFTSELLSFHSLRHAGAAFWALAWGFHVMLLLILIGHIIGLALPEAGREAVGLGPARYERFANTVGGTVGLLGMATLCGLIVRRIWSARVRAISRPEDFVGLALLLLVIVTGNNLRFLGNFEIESARQFLAGLATLRPVAGAVPFAFAVHMIAVALLAALLPFSRLAHFAGVFLNPILTQANNPRQVRYVPAAKGGGE